MAGYDGHRGWINYLAVAADSQRRGFGRRLIDEAEARLQDRGTASEAPTSSYMVYAYDATTMLFRAVEEVAVIDGDTLYIDRGKLREALTGFGDFKGIIGVIACDEFGDYGTRRAQIAHYRDSSMTDIAELPVVHRFAP